MIPVSQRKNSVPKKYQFRKLEKQVSWPIKN